MSDSGNQFRWMATPPFAWRMLWLQFRQDLLAKEAETGFTYTYTWMADQLGHFTLGFLPSFIFPWIALAAGYPWTALAATVLALVGIGIACAKEYADFARSRVDSRASVFAASFDVRAVRDNALTASAFMSVGFLLALAAHLDPRLALGGLLPLVVMALWLGRYWLRLRYFFQQSGAPYVRRIWSFDGRFADASHAQHVRDFLSDSLRHLIVLGAPSTGKTTLAVALATECTTRLKYVRFLSWFAVNEIARSDAESPVQQGAIVWRWDACEVSVIDDVEQEVSWRPVQRLQDTLSKQRTVWVLPGDETSARELIERIRTLLGTNDIGLARLTMRLAPDVNAHERKLLGL